jgi:hypothetical protein
MTSIAKQNTIEALNIYHKAQTNKWEVRVSESGNVRIASWTDRFKSGFRAIFNPRRERTNWNEKAKEAITSKLTKEITSLQKEADKDAIKDLFNRLLTNITKLTDVDEILFQEDETLSSDKVVKKEEHIKSVKANYLERQNFFEKVIPEDSLEEISLDTPETSYIESTVTNKTKDDLVKLWEIKDKKQYGLIIEELNQVKDQDLTKATKVANYTLKLLKNHDLPKDIALNTARKINTAMDEYKIDYDKAFDLIQITGNLVNNGHLDNKLPLNLQLSASLAFIQLTEKKIDRDTALTTVKNRIDKLKKIQNKIPKEMQIDCVHEGKDYEYRVSFSKEQKEKIAESLKTQLKEPLYKKNKVMEEKLKDLSNIHLMNRLDDQSILDGERSSSSFRENGKIISTLNSDPQSNPLKIEEKYESNAFIEVDEEYEIPQNTITNPDSNIRDIPESLLETKFLNPLKNFQIETKLNDKNLTDISHFLSQTTLGTLIGFEVEELKSHVQSTSTKKRGETFYDVDFLTEKTKEGNKRIILKATKYEDGDSLMISNADPNDPSTTLLPINEFFNYEKDDKVGPKKFRQKMNVDFEIQINQNDEIQIRVIDAGLVNKFSIDYDLLDTTPIDEIFK